MGYCIFESMQQANECENGLTQQLQALSSSPWQQQLEIIKGLKQSPTLVKLINHRNYSSEIATLFAAHNPRTKLITALTDFLLELFSTAANQLLALANLLVSCECLLRLLASGNKVVSSSANEIMKSIIGNIDFRSKGRHVKFVPFLEQQFLNSKNNYVREKISLYFLLISTSYYYNTHEALAEFERKVVKEGLQDANEKVRANMRQILENIHHFQKQNKLVQMEKALNRKSTEKLSLKSTKASKGSLQNQSLRLLNNSSINQSSILENFVQPQQEKGDKQGTKNQSFEFYLQKLRNGNTWSMTLLAYESLLKVISKGFLKQASQQLICDTLQALTPYLTEKRSKIFESSSKTFNTILSGVKGAKKERVGAFCQEHASAIIQQVVKNQSVACLILPTIISLNPSFFTPKIAEISANIKVSREKWLLLDSIVSNMQPFLEEAVPNKTNKKISTMVKAMCHHVEQSTIKQKQVSLAALAIISQLKSKYPDEVLTALLCQSDKSLSRILQLAESIDPSLKMAIIDYINSLKSSSRRATVCHSRDSNAQRKAISDSIEVEMIRITQQQVSNLNKLGEMLFNHTAELDCKLYKKLISLLEFLYTSDLIMEYKILMEQLTKASGSEFLSALIDVLTSGSNGEENKEREFHDLLLLELLQVRIRQGRAEEGKMVKCLIEVYRASTSLKKRNTTIEILTEVDEGKLGEWLNEDEMLLVATYKETLQEGQLPHDY